MTESCRKEGKTKAKDEKLKSTKTIGPKKKKKKRKQKDSER